MNKDIDWNCKKRQKTLPISDIVYDDSRKHPLQKVKRVRPSQKLGKDPLQKERSVRLLGKKMNALGTLISWSFPSSILSMCLASHNGSGSIPHISPHIGLVPCRGANLPIRYMNRMKQGQVAPSHLCESCGNYSFRLNVSIYNNNSRRK